MTDISMLFDRSETDELGIRLTAERMGIPLGYLPFHKSAVSFDRDGYRFSTVGKDFTEELRSTRVILNRTQSKNRRLHATTILESLGKQVLNPSSVENYCQSKIRTLLALSASNVLVPKTMYVSSNVHESSSGRLIDNTASVITLIQGHMESSNVVVKPDAGTHGRGVGLARDEKHLGELLGRVTQSITNPSGVVVQEPINKWFYDLRILVYKEKDRKPVCHETALARGGFKEFRTNTFLGNTVFRARLSEFVRREAERSAQALSGGEDAWVIALDAMPSISEGLTEGDVELLGWFKELEEPFETVNKVKRSIDKKRKFSEYTSAITQAYTNYMSTKAYANITAVVNETLARSPVYFHEGNACPEFWEQTRVVAGINPAEDLLNCAQSLLDR